MSQENQPSVELVYWPIRGIIQQVFYLCKVTGVKYTFTPITDKDQYVIQIGYKNQYQSQPELVKQGLLVPNLPYVTSEQGKFSDSVAIMVHIAKLAKRTDLLPTIDNLDTFLNMTGFVNDVRGSFTGMGYSSKSNEQLKAAYEGAFNRHKHRLAR